MFRKIRYLLKLIGLQQQITNSLLAALYIQGTGRNKPEDVDTVLDLMISSVAIRKELEAIN